MASRPSSFPAEASSSCATASPCSCDCLSSTSTDKDGKPVSIQMHIGRRPLVAFGNSDGDLADTGVDDRRERRAVCAHARKDTSTMHSFLTMGLPLRAWQGTAHPREEENQGAFRWIRVVCPDLALLALTALTQPVFAQDDSDQPQQDLNRVCRIIVLRNFLFHDRGTGDEQPCWLPSSQEQE
jgi:hypothetical protein